MVVLNNFPVGLESGYEELAYAVMLVCGGQPRKNPGAPKKGIRL